ncbi:MAG: hypothetical protein QOH61_2841 [Chloroflexota bacterium]|jgi:hypothetical protein|nr:hypothetical protein [Chloroflexota bacterium]
MTNQRNDSEPRPAVMPVGMAGVAAMAVSGAPDDAADESDPRLQELPEHENDHLRGTDTSEGAGVMSAGGTADVTDEEDGDGAAPQRETDDDGLVGRVIPSPLPPGVRPPTG